MCFNFARKGSARALAQGREIQYASQRDWMPSGVLAIPVRAEFEHPAKKCKTNANGCRAIFHLQSKFQDMGIRWTIAVIGGFLLTGAGLSAAIKDADCLECHSDKTLTTTNAGRVISLYVDAAKVAASVHKTNTCASCHDDITVKHPDDNIAARAVDCARCHATQSLSYGLSVHGAALLKGEQQAPNCTDCHDTHEVSRPESPVSPLHFSNLAKTCGQCHPQEAADVQQSVHGQATALGRRDAATCIDCHAEHKIESLRLGSALKISQEVCSKCHASEQLNTKYNLPADRVKTFFESYHGLAAQKGSTIAANCGSCHGYHKILRTSDPESTINRANLVQTCGQCHPGASEKFAQAKVHVDLSFAKAGRDIGGRVNYWVKKIYLALIFGVIGAMLIHNLLLFGRKMAARSRSIERTVVRMDLGQRVQHVVLAVSFIVLAWTGFALKFPDSWIGHFIISDEAVRAWTHRIAGVVLLLAGAYHVCYLLASRAGRRLLKDMAPVAKDAANLAASAKYLAGLSPMRPKIGRFGYAEKMEYWAVVWGTVIMGVTGLAIWFKIVVTHWLPRWFIDVATNIHYYEAVLACLAILVWHFYHVIFDPDVYPINRACLDGRVSRQWQEEEHPLEAQVQSKGAEAQKQPVEAPVPAAR
jgi:formate dehydrogenase gamma subunit